MTSAPRFRLWLILAATAPRLVAQDSTAQSAFAGFEQQPEVGRYLAYFTGPARARMSEWLARGSKYRPAIESKLTQAGLPSEFSYLPIIESGFSNSAVSRAGAVGMWQFMPETARELGLRVDPWIDERRDPTRATDAAIRHIGDLTRTFGSPLLAAAAYNSGAGRVSRGLQKITTGTPDFFTLADRGLLPKETRNYVPQLLAAAAIGRDPARFGFDIPPLPAPAFDSVRVGRPIRLASAERALGLGQMTLAQLNPQLLRGITPPGDSWLRVPTGLGLGIGARLEAVPPASVGPAGSLRGDRLGALVRVRRGDTVSDLAARHGVSEVRLRRLNALPAWYRLRPGQALRLPAA